MTTAQFLHRKADEIGRDADRYSQLQSALKWLKEYGAGSDIKPAFSGVSASSCPGYKELIRFLNERAAIQMEQILKEAELLAWEELRELDRKYGDPK